VRWVPGIALLPLLPLVLGGCELFPFKPDSRPPPSQSYEDYVGKGPFPVHGATARSAGPQLFQQVLKAPQLTQFLRSQNTPDTLEVVEGENGNLQVVLVYSRDSNPPERRIVIERVENRLTAYPPTRLDGSPLGSGRPEPGATQPEPQPEPAPTPRVTPEVIEAPAGEMPNPTEIQMLECPIDPEREDCRDFCIHGGSYEWCP
jgi:hypothetical protein